MIVPTRKFMIYELQIPKQNLIMLVSVYADYVDTQSFLTRIFKTES